LIQADQSLTHFKPMDSKKIVGSINSCARAYLEGRIKDEIWHDCCNCCQQ